MEDNIDKQLYDILHPNRYKDNFPSIDSFEKYIKDTFNSSSYLLFIPTLRKLLKAYEIRENFDQCIVLKKIIDEIKNKQKNKNQ